MNKRILFSMFATLSVLSACQEKRQEAPVALTVVTETVSEGNISSGRQYVGTVEEESATTVSFTGSGIVKTLAVSEGQHVRKGQLVAVLDDTQARNMLAASEASMRQAEDALARMKQLHEANTLPDMKWVEVQSKVDQARAQLDIARKNLADCSIYAPVGGVVGSKMLNAGETALPSQPVASILNIDKVKVKVSIPEREIGQITASTPTTVTIQALGGKTFEGGKIEKGVTADALTHTYDIKIGVENGQHELLPGMVANVLLGQTDQEAQISVPVRAVQQSADGKTFVWAVQDGKAHRSVVALGAMTGNRIVVADGLNVGDKVITAGYQKVSEGSEVKE